MRSAVSSAACCARFCTPELGTVGPVGGMGQELLVAGLALLLAGSGGQDGGWMMGAGKAACAGTIAACGGGGCNACKGVACGCDCCWDWGGDGRPDVDDREGLAEPKFRPRCLCIVSSSERVWMEKVKRKIKEKVQRY